MNISDSWNKFLHGYDRNYSNEEKQQYIGGKKATPCLYLWWVKAGFVLKVDSIQQCIDTGCLNLYNYIPGCWLKPSSLASLALFLYQEEMESSGLRN